MSASNEQCQQFLAAMQDILECADPDALEAIEEMTSSVRTFADAGVMSNNLGLVVRLPDGEEIQLAILGSHQP